MSKKKISAVIVRNAPIVWIDLEMTGLDPAKDTILEIATIITDNEFNILATGPHLVINHPETVLDTMNEWCQKIHRKSGLCDAVLRSSTSMLDAQEQTLDFIKQYCPEGAAVLAGNSVWNDRQFLAIYMPEIIEYLNYRIIDVSSVKELILRWYVGNPHVEFKKSDNHRALEDIQGSIEELKHYQKFFFKNRFIQ